MKIVELNQDDAVKLLYEAIADIQESGVMPSRIVILTDDMRYRSGISSEDELIGILTRQVGYMCQLEEE